MTKKRTGSGPVTAKKLMDRLMSDPEWVRQNEERERQHKKRRAELDANQKPIVDDLHAIGLTVGSVWDLVNKRDPYPEAIPVLVKHLAIKYDPRIREGIARALTVKEARGQPARAIMDELKRSVDKSEEGFRFALANALTVNGDKSMVEEIDALMREERFRDEQRILQMARRHCARTKAPDSANT